MSRLGVEKVEFLKEWAHGVNKHEREVKELSPLDIHHTGCNGDMEQCVRYKREFLEDIASKVSTVYELIRPRMGDNQLVLVPVKWHRSFLIRLECKSWIICAA